MKITNRHGPRSIRRSAPLVVTSIVLTALAIWLSSPATAATIYVNNVLGNDRFNGESARPAGVNLGPVATISRAVRLAGSGGRVVVAKTERPYYENVVLFGYENSGTRAAPFRIEGQGAILDGTIPVPDDAWESLGEGVFRFRPQLPGPQQLYYEGKPLRQVKPSSEQIARPPLAPLEWCYYDAHIYFRVEPTSVPENYQLRYAGRQAGILLYRVEHVEISGLVIQGFALDAVQSKDLVGRVELVGLNLRGNGRSGLSVEGASRVRLSESLVGNNGRAQVRTAGYSRTDLVNCDVLDNTAPKYALAGGELTIDGVVHRGESPE
ncbi:MAG: right-handed parallel beta-helix repeat-containing protein [Planctomycetota bacterium]|nr:MAG: right-handed parallel beta-helix repeat-containing protein [Planctomycetota bacterium]REJ89836.1 MAG: right-handed parallel beta-helix repeat-containing protein [Planctomycetota bacterium]REK18029.1 MAG: right-handed parallel beta-helix repeat-containing protein [Planctomycetota bacterium]REK42328.1 MAG: right-handed parallel beta-helix repeat-containing protein [Planctomycetota bacterium]